MHITYDELTRFLRILQEATKPLPLEYEKALPLVHLPENLLGERLIAVDWAMAKPHPTHEEIDSVVRRAFIMGWKARGDEAVLAVGDVANRKVEGDGMSYKPCPHGYPPERCAKCLVESDFAFDAARERRMA